MSDLQLEEITESGRDTRQGNLLGVQPFMTARDYASEDTFSAKLDSYLIVAGQKGWLTERTIVVWPEYLATWLVSTGEGRAVYQAPTISGAMRALALSHPLPFARRLLSAQEKDKLTASLFRMKAEGMARLYQTVFSKLARQHHVTMVAGSIVLPSPEVREGRVEAGDGPLFSVSAVFGPDGRAQAGLVRKAFPTTAERPFITSAPVADLPVFDTPAGKLGILICADSWYPAAYEPLRAARVELIAVPSFVMRPGLWDQPWGGYDGAAAPSDIEPGDVGKLTEGQAWRKYALAGRLKQAGAKYGINVFLHGSLWDLGLEEGRTLAVDEDKILEVGRGKAALLNLWLSNGS
jgi:hypothetical protein